MDPLTSPWLKRVSPSVTRGLASRGGSLWATAAAPASRRAAAKAGSLISFPLEPLSTLPGRIVTHKVCRRGRARNFSGTGARGGVAGLHRHAAVHAEHLARDVGRQVARQEQH